MPDIELRKRAALGILGRLHTFSSLTDAAEHLFEELKDEEDGFPSVEAARCYLRRAKEEHLTISDDSEETLNEVDIEESEGRTKFSFRGTIPQPMTKEELISSHGINLDQWSIAKIRIKYWDVTAKIKHYTEPNTVEGETLEAGRNFSLAVELHPKKEDPAEVLAEAVEGAISSIQRAITAEKKRAKGKLPFYSTHHKMDDGVTRKGGGESKMLEVSLFDLHLGKLCWSEETNHSDWDTKIASSATLEAAHDLLTFYPSYGRIWLPLGHDFFNSDGPDMGGTGGRTSRGTPQDEDTRWIKSLNTGVDVALALVELCLQHAPVDITIMRGNHDEQRCIFLGRLLAEVYKDHPYVTVDHSPHMLKPYTWGDVFLATAHGQLEKEQKIVTECALKFPEFGSARWREIHVGHGHRMRNAGMILEGWEEQSVRYRMIPSMCGIDSWHSRNLFHNHPAAESYLWDKKDLYLGHHSYSARC